MSSTKDSMKPCLDEPRPGESRGWSDTGLIEAALEGRLDRRAASSPVPLYVPGAASQVPTVRLVETSLASDSPSDPLRANMLRALGFLAVILVALMLADFLQS